MGKQRMVGEEKNYLSDAIAIAGNYLLGFGFAALVVFGFGELFFGGNLLNWLTRLLALGLLSFGALAWRIPFKPVLLPGEDDEWHFIIGWHGHKIGVVRAGNTMIKLTPLQSIEKWRRVNPLLIKVDTPARNKLQDSFQVHARVLLEVYPDQVATTKGLRWLWENYPDNIPAIAENMMKDCIILEMRQVSSFTLAIEEATEATIKTMLINKFKGWEENGVFINENALLVDVMVPDDILQKRKETRAELSTLQTIRDIAHDMGITTDELLIQRTLERLPDLKNQRQSVGEITAVLQMLRASAPPALSEPMLIEPPRVEPTVSLQADIEEPPPMPARPSQLDEPPIISTTFREGTYIPKDDYDPDGEGGSRGIYSPF